SWISGLWTLDFVLWTLDLSRPTAHLDAHHRPEEWGDKHLYGGGLFARCRDLYNVRAVVRIGHAHALCGRVVRLPYGPVRGLVLVRPDQHQQSAGREQHEGTSDVL